MANGRSGKKVLRFVVHTGLGEKRGHERTSPEGVYLRKGVKKHAENQRRLPIKKKVREESLSIKGCRVRRKQIATRVNDASGVGNLFTSCPVS